GTGESSSKHAKPGAPGPAAPSQGNALKGVCRGRAQAPNEVWETPVERSSSGRSGPAGTLKPGGRAAGPPVLSEIMRAANLELMGAGEEKAVSAMRSMVSKG